MPTFSSLAAPETVFSENFWHQQWRQCWHHDNSWFSVNVHWFFSILAGLLSINTIHLLNLGGKKIIYILKMEGFWNETQQDLNTRMTFETPKYPRRPRDQYMAQIVNTLELSAPHQNWGKKKTLSNLVISLVKLQTNTCTYVAAKNGRTVKQLHCETV